MTDDAGALMRIFEMAATFSEKNQPPDAELCQLKAKLKEVEKRGEEVRKKLLEDLKMAIEERDTAMKDKQILFEENDCLKNEMAQAEGESKEFARVKTRAKFISRVYRAYDDAVFDWTTSYENVVAQMRVLNSGVELVTA